MFFQKQLRTWLVVEVVACMFLLSAAFTEDLNAGEYKPPHALELDGSSDGVEIPNTRHAYQHLIEGEGTIEFWCRTSQIRTGRNQSYRQFPFSFSGSIQSRDRDINIGINEGGNWWIVMSDTNNYLLESGYSYSDSEESLVEDKWYHVALVMGGEDRGFYLNGEKKNTWDEFSGETGAWESNLHVGYTPSENRHWHGMLSEVRIWDRNLSAEEIDGLMSGGLEGDKDGMAGYWPLNEGFGSRARDLAGGRDGKLKGNPGRLICAGDVYELKVVETGKKVTLAPSSATDHEEEVRYRWYFGDKRLEGEKDATLVLSDISEGDFGTYFLVDWSGPARVLGIIDITDDSDFERFTEELAYMRLPDWSLFAADLPEEKEPEPGDDIVLGPVELEEPIGEVEYQWYLNDEMIEGADGESYEISGVTHEDLGTYYVRVNDDSGLTPAESTRLRLPDWPVWRSKPETKTVTPGDTARIGPAELYAPHGDVAYKWYKDGEILEGVEGSELTIENVSKEDLGSYQVEIDDQQEVTPMKSREISVIPEDFSEFYEDVLEQIDVGPAWSVHRIGSPRLLTRDGVQYVAYYDDERYIRLAQRELGSSDWSFHRFPVQMRWATGGHANFALALDRDGYIHMCAYRRDLQRGPSAPPRKIYYRSEEPHCIGEFERLYMVSESELPDYPTFLLGSDEELYFEYRAGTSGAGDHVYNIYDPDSRSWERVHDGPFFDGQGRMNAYGFPRLREDGNWHVVWCWRDTPDNATNHSPSYARSEDMRSWKTAGGEPIELPITVETEGVVFDPDAGVGDGISNMTTGGLGFDSEARPIISYHKFDEDGNSQIYNARFEDDRWHRVQATDWDFRWNYGGAGALPRVVGTGSVSQAEGGALEHIVWNRYSGEELIILDEESLEPIRRTDDASQAQTRQPTPEWKKVMEYPELDFEVAARQGRPDTGRMEVNVIGPYLEWPGETEEGVRYVLRWEHAGGNRDRRVSRPWPEPTMLRVYKVRD